MPAGRVPFSTPKSPVNYGWKDWICFKEAQSEEREGMNAKAVSHENSTAEQMKNAALQKTPFQDCSKIVVFWSNCAFTIFKL